jgi:hypothetical protein
MRLLISSAALALVIIASAGCSTSNTNDLGGTFYGAAQNLGQGTVRSWVTLDNSGTPQAMGLRLTAAALNGLPAAMSETVVPVPTQGPAPFDHIAIDWNPQGHEPAGIYDVPHFDFHFYLMTQAEQMAISLTGGGAAKVFAAVAAAEAPAGYAGIPNVSGVPMMGWHWSDPSSPEFNGHPFTATFIYGFYNGHMNFMEPMITKAFLESHTSLSKQYGRPQQYVKPGYYPGGYSVSYDSTSNEYVIALTGLMHF